MENKSHALAAGIFVLGVLVLLVALTVWLIRDNRALRVFELVSTEAVTGLQPQASVRFKGVTVGKVTDIGLDPLTPNQVLIRIAVDEQTPITPSTFATLGFIGVTGLAFVQLDDHGESKTSLPANATPPARIPMRPGVMAQLTRQGERILVQLDETSRRINQLLAPDHQQQLIETITHLGQAASSLKQLSLRADHLLPQLAQATHATLTTLQDTSKRVSESVDEARLSARAFRTMTEHMNQPGGTLDQMAESANTLTTTGQTLNAVTLPHLNRALMEAAHTARSINRATDTVADNPQALIFGNAPRTPGPGEAGFTAPRGAPP